MTAPTSSADGRPRPAATEGTAPVGDGGTGPDEILRNVRQTLLDTLDSLLWQPERLSVRVGEVAIDVAWPDKGTPPVPQAPASMADAETPDPPAAATSPSGRYITAPSVGVFYRAPEPGSEPFVREGDLVHPGRQVAIVEAMKLMLPVEADCTGRILKVLQSDGDPVEYGEPLFVLDESE